MPKSLSVQFQNISRGKRIYGGIKRDAWKEIGCYVYMTPSEIRKRRRRVIEQCRNEQVNRTYHGVSVRNIIRNLARLSDDEVEKSYEELKRDFPAARNAELRRDQFNKIIQDKRAEIRKANTIDLTDDEPPSKQRKITDYIPFT